MGKKFDVNVLSALYKTDITKGREMLYNNIGYFISQACKRYGFTIPSVLDIDDLGSDVFLHMDKTFQRIGGYLPKQVTSFAITHAKRAIDKHFNQNYNQFFSVPDSQSGVAFTIISVDDDYWQICSNMQSLDCPQAPLQLQYLEDILNVMRRELLTKRQQEIISKRYFGKYKITYKELGLHFGITYEAVRKIEKLGLEKLRRGLKYYGLGKLDLLNRYL